MSKRHYGLLADFAHPDAMLDAARAARAAGYRRIEAYSPFPVEGIEEVLEHRSNRPYWFGVVGALVGVAIGLGMQIYANLSYPLEIGGRPLIALQSFSIVTFLLMVSFATIFAVFGLLWLCRLPLLWHPLHDASAFDRATDDRFLLCIRADDPLYDQTGTALWLAERAVSVTEVPA
ncbi:DUF3341 domain-containing protein [Pseudomonas stutzeri]|uniref:DUF3341 domain-containing protein n=1 Tax=Stutzerimonas stutzeri TaxID=316 RepID=A0A2N8SZY8_STUST|nr:DUF3341 domain-containing protein [Stutzerimonas stutzeri]EQM73688.1 hypothetical protein L686_22015 [Stutzerimonas stutzeri MF28]MCQ4248501.1 DUF3341 domain-containing protein [Stutzerimonas stutzeri]PNG08056.1 DUF3341 domain-containing protein [Stutzerimonas stutzeri]